MATILPPPSKRQKLAALEKTQKQQPTEIPSDLGNVRIQFVDSVTGKANGDVVSVPVADATVKNLEVLLNTMQGHDEDTRIPYRFAFALQPPSTAATTTPKQLDIASSVYAALLAPGHSTTESVIPLIYTPQAVFRVRSVTRCMSTLPGHTSPILCVSFPAGSSARLATGSGDATARIWDCETGTPKYTLRGHGSWVLAVAWAPDDSIIATGSMDNTVRLWNPNDGKPIGGAMKGHTKWITRLAFEPYHISHSATSTQTHRLASASKDSTIRVWNCGTQHAQLVLSGHRSNVSCVRWGGTGKIYSSSHDKTIKVWNADTGACICTLAAHAHWVNHLALSTDFVLRTSYHDAVAKKSTSTASLAEQAQARFEKAATTNGTLTERLVSASDDFTMYLWDPASSTKPIARLVGHQKQVNFVTFSPDGQYIASAGFDNHIKLWNGHTGAFVATLRGHVAAVYQCCFSPDSRLLVSASKDTTLKVWSVRTGKLEMDLPGHKDEVYAVDWSPDGQRVGSGGKDKAVKLWRH